MLGLDHIKKQVGHHSGRGGEPPSKSFKEGKIENGIISCNEVIKTSFKGPYADHILIPQGSTGSSIFFDIK